MGFVDTAGKLFAATLKKGDVFVFPKVISGDFTPQQDLQSLWFQYLVEVIQQSSQTVQIHKQC
jgi:hypothetical protein